MEKDFLPWILGGALITTGALAAAMQFAGHAPNSASTPAAPFPLGTHARRTVPPTAASTAAAAAKPQASPHALAANVASLESSAKNEPALPTGEVWQCVVNGQKVFSDKRCGNGASVRHLSDPNLMDVPTAPPRYSYSGYGAGYGGGGAYPSTPAYADDEDDTGNVASDPYPGEIIVARERARREHHHHQGGRGRPPSRNSAGRNTR
jgi:hypothetical protein